jgi:hypothetical protein
VCYQLVSRCRKLCARPYAHHHGFPTLWCKSDGSINKKCLSILPLNFRIRLFKVLCTFHCCLIYIHKYANNFDLFAIWATYKTCHVLFQTKIHQSPSIIMFANQTTLNINYNLYFGGLTRFSVFGQR